MLQQTPPLAVAIGRALFGGAIAAGAAFFAASVQGSSLKASGLIAGAAFFAYLATRGAVEGIYDQGRAQ